MAQLKPKEILKERSKRPAGTKNISLDRIARGTVEESSAFLFKVRLSKKTQEREYNSPNYNPPLTDEENLLPNKKRITLFRKQDAAPGKYKKPDKGDTVRCIYHGNRNNLLPYEVYDMNWNILWKEK
jgi:hypothetical protein